MGARHHGGGGTRNAPEALEALLLLPLHVAYHPLGLGPNPATTTTLALLDIVSPPRPRQHQTRRAPTQASHFACPSGGASHAHLSSRGDITSFAVPASTKSRSKYDPRARRAAADAAPTPPPTHHHMRIYMYARQATRGLDCTHADRPATRPPPSPSAPAPAAAVSFAPAARLPDRNESVGVSRSPSTPDPSRFRADAYALVDVRGLCRRPMSPGKKSAVAPLGEEVRIAACPRFMNAAK